MTVDGAAVAVTVAFGTFVVVSIISAVVLRSVTIAVVLKEAVIVSKEDSWI